MMYIILFFHILSELLCFYCFTTCKTNEVYFVRSLKLFKMWLLQLTNLKMQLDYCGEKKHKSKTLTLRSCKVTNYFPLILQFNRGAARCCGLFMLYLILQTVICTSDFVATPERTANNNNYSPQHVYYSQICKEMWWRLGVWRAKNEHN